MESEEFLDDEAPDWFREIITTDGQDWDDDIKDASIQRQWDAIRGLPKIRRELEVASLARQAMRQARSEASELKTSVQELTQKLPILQDVIAGRPTHNAKKKETIDAKIATAVEDVKIALASLTTLQKKRALKRVHDELF